MYLWSSTKLLWKRRQYLSCSACKGGRYSGIRSRTARGGMLPGTSPTSRLNSLLLAVSQNMLDVIPVVRCSLLHSFWKTFLIV